MARSPHIPLLLILLFLVQAPAPVSAHIEKGTMPDAVAQMEYKILLEFEPDNIDIRNQLGMVYYRLGKLEKARRQFNMVLARQADNFNAIDALGLVAMQQGDTDQALARFQKAIAIKPADAMVYFHLGQVFEKQKKPDRARSAYEKALANLAAEPDSQSKADRARQIKKRLQQLDTER